MDPRWAPYVLRMGLAATFLLAGLDHAVDDGGMAWAVRFMPDPELWGQVLAWGELATGIGLALGLLMPLSAGAAGFVAFGAAAVVLLGGDGLVWQDLVMGGAAVYVLAHGNGPAALDSALEARWPRLRPWLRPFEGPRARQAGALALRATLGLALVAASAQGAWQGTWTSVPAARIAPLLGTAVFVVRLVAGGLVLSGVAPRAAGILVFAVGVVGLVASGFDYHAFILLAAGAGLVTWPTMLRAGGARPRFEQAPPPAQPQPTGP